MGITDYLLYRLAKRWPSPMREMRVRIDAEPGTEEYERAYAREAARVLRPGGRLLVPVFSSIYSKYGLHLKNGLKLPWANLLFSERTIVRAMLRLAADDPKLVEIYPGLADSPERVRDLRRYKDLNDITFRRFKLMAAKTGFEVEWFKPLPTPAGHVVRRLPVLRNTRLMDELSQGAGACLRKPRERSPESGVP
jgi:hypothetical protein